MLFGGLLIFTYYAASQCRSVRSVSDFNIERIQAVCVPQ